MPSASYLAATWTANLREVDEDPTVSKNTSPELGGEHAEPTLTVHRPTGSVNKLRPPSPPNTPPLPLRYAAPKAG